MKGPDMKNAKKAVDTQKKEGNIKMDSVTASETTLDSVNPPSTPKHREPQALTVLRDILLADKGPLSGVEDFKEKREKGSLKFMGTTLFNPDNELSKTGLKGLLVINFSGEGFYFDVPKIDKLLQGKEVNGKQLTFDDIADAVKYPNKGTEKGSQR